MQDLFVRMSASGSCIGPLVQDLCMKSDIATLPAFRAMDTHDLRRGLHFETQKRNFTCIPRTRHARSPQRVALRNQKSQLYQHFARWTRTISVEGCTSKPKNAISPAFRALDTHDLRRGLHFEIRNRNFTCIPRNRHARSPQKVALRNQKTQFHLHSAHSTRTITAEGCTSKSEIATLPAYAHSTRTIAQRVALRNPKTQFHLHSAHSTRAISAEGSHFETILQKYCACHEIMTRGHTGLTRSS